MNILLTGGNGFIGRNFKKYAIAQGWVIYEPKARIGFGMPPCLDKAIYSVPLDYIFHFADAGGTMEYCQQYTAHVYASNVNMNLWMLEVWRQRFPTAKFVGVSSAWAYPSYLESLYEHDMFTGPVDKRIESYAHSKHSLMIGLAAYKKQFNLRGTIITLGTTYGPDDNYSDAKIHLIPTIIKKLWQTPPAITLRGSGMQNRSFVYIDDQIRRIDHLKNQNKFVINATISSDIYSIRYVVNTLTRLHGYQGDVLYDSRIQDKSRVLLSDYEIYAELHKLPQTTIEDGLFKSLNRRS